MTFPLQHPFKLNPPFWDYLHFTRSSNLRSFSYFTRRSTRSSSPTLEVLTLAPPHVPAYFKRQIFGTMHCSHNANTCFQNRLSFFWTIISDRVWWWWWWWWWWRWWWWWIVFVVWLTDVRRLTLFPAGTTVRDPHHRESPTRRKQGLNLRRTRVQALLNEVVQ